MPKKYQNVYDDDFESDELEETDTLVSRNRPPRPKSASGKKSSKKTSKRPSSSAKLRTRSAPGIRTGKDLWMTAVKKGKTVGLSGRHPESPRHKTPIEYWVDTLRKTGGGMSTESTTMNTFSGLKKTNDKNLAYLSTPHYMRQVMGIEKPRKNNDDMTARPSAGTPAYKSPEEYYDEVLGLKKHIALLNQDNSTIKAKVRRLEEDNIKKEKEIEGLLDPGKSEELRRTLGDRKSESGAVIHSLKQKILKLEMQLRDKEASYVKLAADLKTTKVDEMRVQMESFYQEIVRLQHSKDTGNVRTGKEGGVKIKALNETVLRLSKTNEQLQSENKALKEDLQKAMEHESGGGTVRMGDYEDMNRKELLRAITKLETRAENAEKRADLDNVSLASYESRRSEIGGKITLEGTIEERLHQLDQRETQLLEEIEKQKGIIKRLRAERTRHRKEFEGRDRDLRPPTPRQISPGTPLPKKRSRMLSGDSGRQAKIENLSQKHAAQSIQRRWRQHKQREAEEHRKVEQFQANRAARQIQTRWLGYQHRKHERESDDATYMIQSALRGHHARRQRLHGYHTDDDDDDVDTWESEGSNDGVYLIQSSLRGHKARKNRMRLMRLDSTGDEEDDGDTYSTVSRKSYSRRPSSAKYRSPSGSISKNPSHGQTRFYTARASDYDDDDDVVT